MDRHDCLDRVRTMPVARLATRSTRADEIDLVPVTFAIVGDTFVTAVDHKPKSTRALARLANVRRHGSATVLVDQWTDDWAELWWVRLRGHARVVDDPESTNPDAIDALVTKYPQYRAIRPAGPLIVLSLDDVRGWTAT